MKIICTKEEFAAMLEICAHRVEDDDCKVCPLNSMCGGEMNIVKSCEICKKDCLQGEDGAQPSLFNIVCRDQEVRERLFRRCIIDQHECNCQCCVLRELCGLGKDENNNGKPADIREFLKVWGEKD